jgi:hypothetical protein
MSVLASSVAFKQIVGSIGYSVAASTPWEDGIGATNLGTMIDLKLASPLSGIFNFPGVQFTSPTTYTKLSVPGAVSGVTTLTVLVDLRTKAVVSVEPPEGSVTATPNTPTPGSGYTGN